MPKSQIVLDYPNKMPAMDILNIESANLELSECFGESNENTNMLFFGDNLPILKSLIENSRIKGNIKLVYIDPPFSTKRVFKSENGKGVHTAYSDNFSGYEFIEYLRKRLILIKELLAEDGSIYVHLDQKAAHHIKIVMDEIFGENNLRNWITRQKCHSKNYTKNQFGNVQDFILFYTKSENYVWNRPYQLWDEEKIKKEYPLVDEKGRYYKKVPIYASGIRNGKTGEQWRGMYPPKGKHWQFTPAKLDVLDKQGDIIWSKNGNPRRKVYLDQSKGIPIGDIWLDCRDYYNQNQGITGYPTEKNEQLLKRIILASSNPRDIILDCFAGSGTTLSVAHKLERQWIGIDNGELAIKTIKKRLANLPNPPKYNIFASEKPHLLKHLNIG